MMASLNGARAYQQLKMRDLRNERVKEYAYLVKRIALHLKARLPASVELDDLIQAGMLGLMDASVHYEEGHGATFETYAGIRIRGSMIDQMREMDWAPRSVHANSRQISEVMSRLANQLGREPSDKEMAQALGVDIEKYHQMLVDSASTQLIGIEDIGVPEDVITAAGTDSREDQLFKVMASVEFKRDLAHAISTLPEREQHVLSLYYDQEMNLREIGAILDIGESRVCQVLSQAMSRLRVKLKHWQDRSVADQKGSENKEKSVK